MPTWVKIAPMMTAGGDPQQFFKDAIHEHEREVFIIGALRVSGGDDSAMPRRVVGMGPTREHARRSLEDALSRYDPTYRLVSSR